MNDVEHFEGLNPRECGEHRTLGRRAWCHDCSQYCSPIVPCNGCELPGLRDELNRLRAKADEAEVELTEFVNLITPLLHGTANALKGEPGPLRLHDWSDLSAAAARVVAERDRLRTALEVIATPMVGVTDGCQACQDIARLALDGHLVFDVSGFMGESDVCPGCNGTGVDDASTSPCTVCGGVRLNVGHQDTCGLCGRDPAAGFAFHGDVRYCHGDNERPSCYEKASWRQAFGDDGHQAEGRHVTKTGKVLTDADIQALADEAERGYDVSHLLSQEDSDSDE